MLVKQALFSLAVLARACPASAVPIPAPKDSGAGKIIRVEGKVAFRELSAEVAFLVASGSQANNVAGSDRPVAIMTNKGEGVEFHKLAMIVNILPEIDVRDPKRARAQIQIELSGPINSSGILPAGQPERTRIPELVTSQFQTEFSCRLGERTVISESPMRVEVLLSEVSASRER